MTSGRIVFMGSPAVAVTTLEELAKSFEIPLVVTQPDRPSGRGRKMTPTAVHVRAAELGLSVHTTADVNSPSSVGALKDAGASAIVVVSFGQILKREALAAAPLGCLNLHFSLLPELRGAAPVAWALIRGYSETGVSIIKMARRMDAGPVLASLPEKIADNDTAATLYDRLGPLGARLMSSTVCEYLAGRAHLASQDESLATFAPKVTRETGAIHWNADAVVVDRLIRGLSGQLEAYAFLEAPGRIRVTLYSSRLSDAESHGPGLASRGPSGELLVGCGRGVVEITEIQAEGRKRVSGADFANGHRIAAGVRFLDGQ